MCSEGSVLDYEITSESIQHCDSIKGNYLAALVEVKS